MEQKASLATATDWRAEVRHETRLKIVHSICTKLRERLSAYCSDATNWEKISKLAIEYENKMFINANSKEHYYSVINRKTSRSENNHESSGTQDRPAFSSSPQMTNQPHRAVPNLRYQQPAMPNSPLQQHIQQLTPQPQSHEQLHRQKMNVSQTHEQVGINNQRRVCSQSILNLPCRPPGLQCRDSGILMSTEMFIQHPKVVDSQPNEKLTAQVKEEVIDEDFQASTSSYQHHSAIKHQQHESSGESIVSNGNPNEEDWLDQRFSEKQRFKGYLPLVKKAYQWNEQRLQTGQIIDIMKWQHDMNVLRRVIIFLESPREGLIPYTKERFDLCMDKVVECVTSLEKWKACLVNKQLFLHRQPGRSQSRMNSVQQSDNVNPHSRPLNLATTGSSDITSPLELRNIGFSGSEAGLNRNNLLQNRQHSEIPKQEFHSSWIQQTQKPTENIQAMKRTRMSLEYHMNSKFSPQTHQASQLFQSAERGLAENLCASSCYERASPTPSSSTVEHGKNSSNVSHSGSSLNFQSPDQACNSLKLLNTKTEIQVQSHHDIRSSSTKTSQLAELASHENNGQLSPATQPPNRLLKAVESISNEALRVAVSEISSVWNMENRITEPCCHEKTTQFSLQCGCSSSTNMKRKISARTLNDVPLPCGDIDRSEPTVASRSKKLKKLSDNALLEEMRNINKQFIETVLEIDSMDNVNRRFVNAGTVLRCSYNAATGSKNSVVHSANTLKLLPVLSVKLLVPLDYPEKYPVFLSKFNTNSGTEDEAFRDMSNEATSMLRAVIRTAPGRLSLEDYARAWDECARIVVSEHARRAGGGCFSSQYGTWEDCVAAT